MVCPRRASLRGALAALRFGVALLLAFALGFALGFGAGRARGTEAAVSADASQMTVGSERERGHPRDYINFR